MLDGKGNQSMLLIYSNDKEALAKLGDALKESNNESFAVTRNEIAIMLVEAVRDKKDQKMIKKCKTEPILIICDFEVIAGKEHSQKIIYEILRHRYGKSHKTIILSSWDVFAFDTFSERIKVLLESADKYNV